jgi:hypothetical protein
MGYNCCFFLNFVPLHIESPYNFWGTGPILRVKNPLQRVNGHAGMILCHFIFYIYMMQICSLYCFYMKVAFFIRPQTNLWSYNGTMQSSSASLSY